MRRRETKIGLRLPQSTPHHASSNVKTDRRRGMLVNQPSLAGRVRELLAVSGLTDVRVLDRAPAWGAVELASQLAGAPPAAKIPA